MEVKNKMTETKTLEVGEKYLSISLLGQVKLAAFPNKNKKSDKEPDFTGNGIAVWVNEKRAQIKAPASKI